MLTLLGFQRQMTTVLVLPENIFDIEVYSRSTWFHFELKLSKFSGFL